MLQIVYFSVTSVFGFGFGKINVRENRECQVNRNTIKMLNTRASCTYNLAKKPKGLLDLDRYVIDNIAYQVYLAHLHE